MNSNLFAQFIWAAVKPVNQASECFRTENTADF